MRFFQRFFGKPQTPRKSSKGFRKTFVLEPILTPSGLLDVDSNHDSSHLDSVHVPDLHPVEIPDFTPHPLIDDGNLEHLDFFGAGGDPDLLPDHPLELATSEPIGLHGDTHILPDHPVDTSEPIGLHSDTHILPDHPLELATSEPIGLHGTIDATAHTPEPQPLDNLHAPISDPPPDRCPPVFKEGVFTVGASGRVGVDNLFDGGAYQGELAIFNIEGLEGYDFHNPDQLHSFLLEASSRALSDSNLGHVVISDITEAAKFTGHLPEGNFNSGEYMGVKTFAMNPGDKFAVMIVPDGSVQHLHDVLSSGGEIPHSMQPLFSLETANPNDSFHMGQIADVTGDGNTFAMEDLRTDGWTDRDYNDIVFQVRGATGHTSLMDDVVNPNNDWRGTDIGHTLIEYAKPYVEPTVADVPIPHDVPVTNGSIVGDIPLPEAPASHQPLIGVIDTGFSAHNPDLDYSHIILGQDRIDGDANPLLAPGEGSEHGTHILGIIGATQDNGVGIDGINDTAPIWVGRAVGSGQWADSLVEFVDASVHSGQPHAVANLSLDLTQVNPDGSVTTRYEFTPQERAAIEYARQHDVLLVVAAGNDGGVMSALGQSSQEFDNIITVGAAERVNDAVAFSNAYDRTDYSSYGYGLDIMAPGGSISSPELSLTGDGVGTMAGTSVATAKVTGAVSQVWAANPGLSYRQVIEILKDTATDLKDTGWDVQSGAGLLNMAAAIHLAKATQPEEYEVLPTLIPDTWGGEGKVTPMERASFSSESFQLRVWPSDGVQFCNSPNPNDISNYYAPQNTWLDFDGWDYGTVNIDPVSGEQDALYYRTWYNGQAYWVPSIWIDGYPPSNPPLLPSNNSPSNSNVGYDGTSYHSTYINTFDRKGGESALGSPTNNVHPWENGYTQDFSGGSDGTGAIMKSNANDDSYWVGGDFWNKFLEMNGASGLLSYPTSDRYSINSGWRQNFQGGAIIQSALGIFPLFGGIGAHYLNAEDGEQGRLGFPTSGEIGIGNGVIIQNFENGRIVYGDGLTRTEMDTQPPVNPPVTSITINGYTLSGDFYSVWQQYRDTLGSPIENVQSHDSGATYQRFENGSIVSSPNGTFPLYGALRQKYLNEGGLNSWLGTPKSAEYSLGNGVIQQDFSNGYIIWNGRTATAYKYGDRIPHTPTPTPNPNPEQPLVPNPDESNPLKGFISPLKGVFWQTQGWKTNGSHNTTNFNGWNAYAIDFDQGFGSPVYAMRSGIVTKVISSYPDNGRDDPALANQANLVYIDHGNGFVSQYLHLKEDSVIVQVGDTVIAGQQIAEQGNSGWSTASHLHVAVHRNGGISVPFEIPGINPWNQEPVQITV